MIHFEYQFKMHIPNFSPISHSSLLKFIISNGALLLGGVPFSHTISHTSPKVRYT